jgi:hypothetical protein
MNLREQFSDDPKGHEDFNAYCRAYVAESCIRLDGTYRSRVHPARRKAADAKRTAEVQTAQVKP